MAPRPPPPSRPLSKSSEAQPPPCSRALSLLDFQYCLLAGGTIGSFDIPDRQRHSPALPCRNHAAVSRVLWLLGGPCDLTVAPRVPCRAWCFMFPYSGGQYVYCAKRTAIYRHFSTAGCYSAVGPRRAPSPPFFGGFGGYLRGIVSSSLTNKNNENGTEKKQENPNLLPYSLIIYFTTLSPSNSSLQ